MANSISESVIKQAEEVAQQLIKSGDTLGSFQFGEDEKSLIWVSTDSEKISGFAKLTVGGKTFFYGLLKANMS